MIKFMTESKKNELWRQDLRSNPPECKHHKAFILTDVQKTQNSNFGNILQKQEALLDFKRERISNNKGLRKLILRKNRLANDFAESLQRCLRFDEFVKVIDLSHNKMSEQSMVDIICNALNDNHSVLSIDFRYNTGTTKQILYHTALSLLKNIAIYKKNSLNFNKEWINFNTINNKDISK